MLKLNNFAEFLFKKLLEGESMSTLPIWFSDRFRRILEDIFDKTGNEVAQRLLYEEGKHGKKIFIDIDDDSIDKISFILSNKVEDVLGRNDNLRYLNDKDKEKIFNARQRSTMGISRFINELFNNEYKTQTLSDEQKEENKRLGRKTPAQHLEAFVNSYKALRQPGKFELVDGLDISYWYSYTNYESQNASLGDSCMKDEDCEPYFNFYAKNPKKVSLLIMKSRYDDAKIIGRALVWTLTEPEGRIYMDRIYVNYEHDYENFKNYARNKGWLFKKEQNMYADEYIVDSKTNESSKMTLIVKGMKPNETYPYLDTLKYYNPTNEILTNNVDIVKDLSTDSYNLEDVNGNALGIESYTYEELVSMYKEDIIDDLKYYAGLYPYTFWNNIDDDKFMSFFKDNELDHFLHDFEHFVENDEHTVVRYIVENRPKSDWGEEIYGMDSDDLIKLIDKLDIREDVANALIDETYKDYTAKSVYQDIYGLTDDLEDSTFDQLANFFDGRSFADEVARNEDEDWLREKYQDE
jgi:hypothetical protein